MFQGFETQFLKRHDIVGDKGLIKPTILHNRKNLEALFMGTPLIKVLLVGLRQAPKKKGVPPTKTGLALSWGLEGCFPLEVFRICVP